MNSSITSFVSSATSIELPSLKLITTKASFLASIASFNNTSSPFLILIGATPSLSINAFPHTFSILPID